MRFVCSFLLILMHHSCVVCRQSVCVVCLCECVWVFEWIYSFGRDLNQFSNGISLANPNSKMTATLLCGLWLPVCASVCVCVCLSVCGERLQLDQKARSAACCWKPATFARDFQMKCATRRNGKHLKPQFEIVEWAKMQKQNTICMSLKWSQWHKLCPKSCGSNSCCAN